MEKHKLQEIFNDKVKYDSLKKRLWSKIKIGHNNECWEWTAKAKGNFGYGSISAGRKYYFKAHRVAYAMHFGVMKDTEYVLHKCDNPKCCNPMHLFLGSAKDNTHDCIKKDRLKYPPHHYGERHHNVKITKEQFEKIKLDDRRYNVIAKEYGVCEETIGRIKRNQTWKQNNTTKNAA